MKLSKDNYQSFLDQAVRKMEEMPRSVTKEVQRHFDKLRNDFQDSIKNADELLRDNSVLRIGIVGQVKAGKSSFLNSLIFDGENVLPKAATPMTAGLTILEYSDENEFEVEFYNNNEWEKFKAKAEELKIAYTDLRSQDPTLTIEQVATNMGQDFQAAKELVDKCSGKALGCIGKESKKHIEKFSDVEDMQSILNNYVGANGVYTPVVKSLTIRLNDERLKDIQIVDTPGVNDPVVSREERTREFLNRCHGVFFLSYSGRFFDSTDVDFLINRISGNGIGSVVVIASKYDSVLQDAGVKFHDDLSGAAEYCEKALRKQMIANISRSEYTGSIPSFDFSSGIGYSIYKKAESRWDATERHVVSRMKNFYPSFFATPEDVKQTFYDLAQIDEIQSQYLNKMFVANKNAVIQSKLDNYFQGVSRTLSKEIDSAIVDVNSHLKMLEDGNGKDLTKKKNETELLSNDLNRGINNCTTEIENILRNGVKEIENSLSLSKLSIIKSRVERGFIRKSTFWGSDKDFMCDIDSVDDQRTLSTSKSALESELKRVDKSWKDIVNKASDILSLKLKDIIKNAEKKDTEGVNVSDQLMDIVYSVINAFGANHVFCFSDIRKNSENSLREIMEQVRDIPTYIGKSMEEYEAKDYVRDQARKICRETQSRFDSWKDNVETEISNKLKEISKTLSRELSENRAKMIGEIKNRFSEFITQLELELKDIETNKKHYKNSLEILDNLKNMI